MVVVQGWWGVGSRGGGVKGVVGVWGGGGLGWWVSRDSGVQGWWESRGGGSLEWWGLGVEGVWGVGVVVQG